MKDLPTFYEMQFAESSKIFESEDIMGLSPEQLNEAENFYNKLVEKIEKGEEIDEGFLGALAGGAVGALAGPAIMKSICKILGIDEKGTLGKLLTSRLVTTSIGLVLGK